WIPACAGMTKLVGSDALSRTYGAKTDRLSRFFTQFRELFQHHLAFQTGQMVNEQYAFLMVNLMLQTGAEKTLNLIFMAVAILVLPARGYHGWPFNIGILVRHREAAFAINRQVFRRVQNFGIDKHPRVADDFMVMVAMLAMFMIMFHRFLKVDHQYPFGHANLYRGKANARRVIHGFKHVCDQRFQLIIKHSNRL